MQVDLKVHSYDQDFLDVSWTIPDTPGKLNRYHLYLDRSADAPAGPWTQLAGPFFNTDGYRDYDADQLHIQRRYYYRLRVVDPDTLREEIFGPAAQEAPPDLILQEIRRRFVLVMQEYAGRRLLVFPRITRGFRCPTCIYVTDGGRGTQRRRVQNCLDCFDTGYVGGYGSPIAVFGQISPPIKETHKSEVVTSVRERTRMKLPFFPPVKPGDMIVEAENFRWELENNIDTTEKARAAAHQAAMILSIPPSDIRYRVPVHLDSKLEAGPPRERTRLMCLPDAPSDGGASLGSFLDSLIGG